MLSNLEDLGSLEFPHVCVIFSKSQLSNQNYVVIMIISFPKIGPYELTKDFVLIYKYTHIHTEAYQPLTVDLVVLLLNRTN